ncbi:MAG: hypothetical protein LBG12_03415 [Synergistaceae bacterium]|nr:hypothetical protein [Synergistaceae bacterium]
MVSVTEKEKESPLYKYFEMDMAEADPTQYEMAQVQLNPAGALDPIDMNLLFDAGYLPYEFGYCRIW